MAKNKILDTVHELMTEAHKVGAIDTVTMREFDAVCLPPVKEFTPKQIQKIRTSNNASQAVMASYMNMTTSSIQKWECGAKKPSGASLKLLNLIDQKGLAALG